MTSGTDGTYKEYPDDVKNPSIGVGNDAYEPGDDHGDDDFSPTSKGTSDVNGFVDVVPEVFEDDDPECGWFNIRPRFIQCFNNSKGYLLFICFFAAAQSMTVNGLVYVATSTLERRFHLTSTKSGFISSSYDLTVLIVILFVTYFGEKSHKPRILGTGAFIFFIGNILFTLPHYLTDYYEPRDASHIRTCDINETNSIDCEDGDDENLSKYYGCFISAQVLHGLGAAALYTLNMAYFDDNVKPTSLAVYIGIFQTMAILGPTIAFIVGSYFLGWYTDLRVDPADVGLTPEHPLWVGAWWIPFLIPAGVCLIVFLPILGFPRSLPGSKALHQSRAETGHKGSSYIPRTGLGNKIRDFPRAIWNLIKNIPFMCICFSQCCDNFILLGLSVFGPKYMESQYNLTVGQAALIAGGMVVPAALIGCIIGGILIRCFNMGFVGQLRMVIVVGIITVASFGAFFVRCDTVPFAGVNVMYNNTNVSFVGDDYGGDLTDTCNEDCNCDNGYDPVCGSNNVLYYSPCHASCFNEIELEDGDTEYTDCRCIKSEGGDDPSKVVTGKCDYECPEFYLFLILTFIGFCSSFFASVPNYTLVIRCVSISQRAFALGVTSILYRLLGSVPGPLAYGALIDKSCVIWEVDCDGNQKCWLYDNDEMGVNFFALCAGGKGLSVVFSIAAYFAYKPEIVDDDDTSEKDLTEKKEHIYDDVEDDKVEVAEPL